MRESCQSPVYVDTSHFCINFFSLSRKLASFLWKHLVCEVFDPHIFSRSHLYNTVGNWRTVSVKNWIWISFTIFSKLHGMCLLLHTFWNCDALNYILVLNDPADVLGHFWPQKNQPKKEACYYYILMCSVLNFLQQHVILCTYSYVQSITNVPNTWKSFNCTNYSWEGSEEHFGPSAHGATLFLM